MDKVSGELSLLTYDSNNKEAVYAKALDWDVVERVDYLKAMVLGSEVPQVCYAPVADGVSGNYRLQSGCVYCPYRNHCWPSVREFGYSGGHKYFTTVVKEPRVLEIPKGF